VFLSPARRLVVVALLGLAAACSGDVILIKPPPPDSTGGGGGGGGGGGTVQRARLTITVRVVGADSALASAIGSPGGILSSALVTIARFGSSFRQTDTADAVGLVVFERLLPGDYNVSVIRILTPTEVTALGSGNEDVNAFGGGATVKVDAPAADTVVAALAGRRGSLVISEAFTSWPYKGAYYYFGNYVELYNNSDTTIYLDGKLFGKGPGWPRDYSHGPSGLGASCEVSAPIQNDPDGLWSVFLYAFPGSGREHPLGPGGTAVIATDAIDHHFFDPRLPDLSHADFELIGTNDVDNPGVPNMLDVGAKQDGAVLGHGMAFGSNPDLILFVSNVVDLGSVPRARMLVPLDDFFAPRIPRDQILDVFASTQTPATEAAGEAAGQLALPCPNFINPVFDRQRAELIGDNLGYTGIARRVFTTLPDGRVVLLRTRSSANDFAGLTPLTPGQVP
jgi:hypothetical protein